MIDERDTMKRGTKEFYEIQESFEMSIKNGAAGYIPCDFTKDASNSVSFYANGKVNDAFRAFMAGYVAAKYVYQEQ